MPEPFIAICPHCQAKLKLKDPALIGKVARCPGCQEKFTVARATATPRPKAAAKASHKSSSVKRRVRPQPKPAQDDELDPWLNDDLSSFEADADDTGVPSNTTAAPPAVRGVSKKRKSTDKPSAKKRKKASVGAEHLSWIGWVVGGCIAGLIGASAWGAIAAFTFSEWGILA